MNVSSRQPEAELSAGETRLSADGILEKDVNE